MEIISNSVKDTLNLGKRIARSLQKGDIVCLFGQFGSGKTVFAKGLASGMGIRKEEIISPSFVLIREYPGSPITLYHFDLYRLEEPQDIIRLGYEEYLYDEGVAVIEWADRLKCLLPKEYLKIELFVKSSSRRLFKIRAIGDRYEELLGKLNENIRH